MYAVTLQHLAHEALGRALRLASQRDLRQGAGAAAQAGCEASRAGAGSMAGWPCAVDATAGNGHDTLFLAQCVGAGGRVWVFDVQEAALAATRARVAAAGLGPRVRCILDGHEHLERHVPPETVIHGAMFNLGYLPGASRSGATVVTRPETTLAALDSVLQRLASGGVVSVHIYTGHEGGEEECAALLPWAASLPHPLWQVLHTSSCNKPLRAEHLLLIART